MRACSCEIDTPGRIDCQIHIQKDSSAQYASTHVPDDGASDASKYLEPVVGIKAMGSSGYSDRSISSASGRVTSGLSRTCSAPYVGHGDFHVSPCQEVGTRFLGARSVSARCTSGLSQPAISTAARCAAPESERGCFESARSLR